MRSAMARLLISIAITLASVAAAQAYSDEAIRNAEDILRNTKLRYDAGEVEKQDLALATYNVLNMRRKAGKLDAAAFCKASKPELESVAAAFQPEDGKADAKKAWLDAVAGMDGNEAKCREASAATERLMFGALPADYSDAGLKNARAFVATTAAGFARGARGDVTAVDVAAARYAVIDIKHGLKTMAQGAYCQTGAPLLQEIAGSTEAEAGVGQRMLAEVIAARRRLYAVTVQCAGDLHGDLADIVTRSHRAADKVTLKDFDGAIADFTELLTLVPQDLAALLGRGRAYAGKGDNDRATADFAAVLRLDAFNVDALRERGDLRLANADNDSAIADYTGLLALEPDDLEAHINRASAFFSKKDYASAVADYTFAIDNPPRPDPFLRYFSGPLKDVLAHRAYAYVVQRDYDHAIADYTALLGITPRDPAILGSRANAYYANHDYERAIADYTASIALDPKNLAARLGRAGAYAAKADYRGAIADYGEAISLDPKNADAFIQRGVAYEQIKDYEHAIADDSAAIQIDPGNAEAFNARCWQRAIGGHLREALPDCDTALRLRPGDANTLDSRGFVRLMLGALDGAITDYDAALKTDPKIASALYGRGVAKRRKGDIAGADADVAAAKAIEPGIAERLAEYGMR